MAGVFELYTDARGEYRFRLKSGNGEIVLASEGYKTRAAADNGIESVRKNAADAARFEKKGLGRRQALFRAEGGEPSGHRSVGNV